MPLQALTDVASHEPMFTVNGYHVLQERIHSGNRTKSMRGDNAEPTNPARIMQRRFPGGGGFSDERLGASARCRVSVSTVNISGGRHLGREVGS